jgi:hypothetical protein
MNTTDQKPLVIGCHHKTGTSFLFQFLRTILARVSQREGIIIGASEERKLPLSKVLEKHEGRWRYYFNIWFEHEVDFPANSIRFFHFVRHPVNWVRSAYLYHKKGGPSDRTPWLKWRLFRVRSKYVSYFELLNGIEEEPGLLIEAIRCYPEIAGTARAAKSSRHLEIRHQTSLEQFASNFEQSVQAACHFLGFDADRIEEIAGALGEHDLRKRQRQEMPPNVTRHAPNSTSLEQWIAGDPHFQRLYSKPARDMEFELDCSSVRPKSWLGKSIVDDILESEHQLLSHPLSPTAQESLQTDSCPAHWLTFALQGFGLGGHLMMYQYIQRILDESELGS